MLLTLNVSSLRAMLKPTRSGRRDLPLRDLPKYVHETLGLSGLNMTTDLLAGLGRADLEQFRDLCDKASCACLCLIEPEAQPMAARTSARRDGAVDRVQRIVEAGALLGCSAVAVPIEASDDDASMEQVIDCLKRVMEKADRRDMNVLIAPGPGLTSEPERLTDLIKRVGGFRTGTFPDVQTASGHGDPEQYLKRITPYAAAVSASVLDLEIIEIERPEPSGGASPKGKPAATATDEPEGDDDGPISESEAFARLEADLEALLGPDDEDSGPIEEVRHPSYDLVAMMRAVSAVGFDGNLAIDYRGGEDGTLGVLHARTAIEQALERVGETA